MTRGTPYGEDILSDRGPMPKNAGDRLAKSGRSITLEPDAQVNAGEWVSFNGDGTVTPLGQDETSINDGDVDGLAKHDFDPNAGDSDPERPDNGVTIHTCGVVRANIDPTVSEVDKIDDVESDVLVYFT